MMSTTYKIGLMSDLHDVGGSKHAIFTSNNAAMITAGCVARIWLGDMVESWVEDDIEALCALRVDPTYWIMGGHDGGLVGEDTYPKNFVDIINKYQPHHTLYGDFYIDIGNWRLILLNNGTKTMSSEGITWLGTTLGGSSDKYIIIFTHEGLAPNTGDEANFIFATDAGTVRDVISTHLSQGKKIRACLYGHGHASGYNYPQSNFKDGVLHFQISTSIPGLYSIMTLHDDGQMYIDGYNGQASLCNSSPDGRTYVLNSVSVGDDTVAFPDTYPRKSIEALVGKVSFSVGDCVVIQNAPLWQKVGVTGFLGSLHYHVSDSYTTTMTYPGVTLRGIMQKLPQGDVFKITAID